MTRPANLLSHHGEAVLFPDFLDRETADDLLNYLLSSVKWEQQPVKIFGRLIPQPRLTASFADEGISYGYSGISLKSETWPEKMAKLKRQVEAVAKQEFNTSLLNLYRNGKDYMGWHRDNEGPLGTQPLIASLSLGAERMFELREYASKSNVIRILLSHGSLLLMGGDSQQFWEHRLPKSARIVLPRVNITFRKVKR